MVALLILLVFVSCSKTEVLNAPNPQSVDTLIKAHRDFRKDIIPQDTTRVPITFNPSVEDWEEQDIEM